MTLLESCTRRQRSMLASGRCASIEASHPGDVPYICACGRKRQAMPRLSLSHPIHIQPPCASSCSLMWPDIVSRGRQLRSLCVLGFELASMAALVSSVAEELTNSNVMEWTMCRCGPLGFDFVYVARTFNEWFNVELCLLPAHGSCVSMRATCPVDLKLNGGNARAWRAMPSIPRWDPLV